MKEKPGQARRASPERRAGGQFHIKQKFYSRWCTMHSPRGFLEAFAASPRAFLSGSGLTVFFASHSKQHGLMVKALSLKIGNRTLLISLL